MLKFEVANETRFFENADALFMAIEYEYSRDVADYLRVLIKAMEEPCNGECDYVYQQDGYYRDILRDAHDGLTEVLNKERLDRKRIQAIADEIYAEM